MRTVLLASTLLAMAAPAFADSTKSDIDKANAKFVAAFNKGDAAGVGQFYTPDATALPPGADMAKGRAAIQTFWQGAIQGGLKNIALTALTVERYGRAAREIGRFSADAPGSQNQVSHVEGKYVVIWKKTHDGWQIDTDIWNMNK